jgi:hypothetical protein
VRTTGLLLALLLVAACSEYDPDPSEVQVFRELERLNDRVGGYELKGRGVTGIVDAQAPFEPGADLALPYGFSFSQEVDDPLSDSGEVLYYFSGPDPRRPDDSCTVELHGRPGADQLRVMVVC